MPAPRRAHNYRLALCLAACLLTMTACSRSTPPAVQRVAVLPFDNLTGEGTLDWIRLAVPKAVAAQLTGTPGTLAFLANALRDAEAGAATHYLHGYFDRRAGALHFEASIEDASSHKMTNAFSAGGVLGAANAFAHTIDSQALPFSTSNAEAADAWGKGDYERATSLDPDFSAAWLAWTETLAATKQAPQAAEVASKAVARTTLRSAIERAQIEADLAGLRQDEPARVQALTKLARLVPTDAGLLARLADSEMSARQFPEAASVFEELIRREPSNATARNMLGYAYTLAGDLTKAQKAFEAYGRLPGQEANSIDSQGEVYFLYGRFQEAEKLFLAAHAKNPQLLGGGDLLKAAHAHWLAGDLPGADQIFERYLEFRKSGGDNLLVWRRSIWLYTTGRVAEAKALLMEAPNLPGNLSQKQLEVWNSVDRILPTDLAALKAAYDRTPPSTGGLAVVLYAQALWKAGRQEEARKIAKLWPLPDLQGEPLLASLLFPKYLELRQMLEQGRQ